MAATGDRPRATYDVGVLHKTLDVLETLAEGQPLTVVEISEQAGISKTAAYRILGTLEGRGYVFRDERSRSFGVGPGLLALSRAILSSTDLIGAARPEMLALRDEFGETVNLGALSRGRLVYLEMLESEHGLRTTVAVGSSDHLHSTALGRAILAALPPAEARAILAAAQRPRVTPRTKVALAELEGELAATRERGYSLDDEENEPGARCVGVAVVDDERRPLGALSISGPAPRMTRELLPLLGERLAAAAARVERAIGVGEA